MVRFRDSLQLFRVQQDSIQLSVLQMFCWEFTATFLVNRRRQNFAICTYQMSLLSSQLLATSWKQFFFTTTGNPLNEKNLLGFITTILKFCTFSLPHQLAERLYSNTITHRCPPIEPIDGVCLTDDGLSDSRVQMNDDELALPFRTHNSSPSMNSNGVSGLSRQFRNSISNRLRFKSKATERAKVTALIHKILTCLIYFVSMNCNESGLALLNSSEGYVFSISLLRLL